MPKLIILRGPSASGKSTVAHMLKQKLEGQVVILDFDVYRGLFGRQGDYYPTAAKMILSDARIALDGGYEVIIDGFYRVDDYPNLLDEIIGSNNSQSYMFYFDTSLHETIRRHKTRKKSKQFGETELREWYYKPKPSGVHDNEYGIPEGFTADKAANFIMETIKQ